METAVTVYMLKENEELATVPEMAQEWKTLIEEAGLEGQQALLAEKTENPTVSPIPYLWMNEKMKRIFSTLCKRKVDINDYDKMPIPIVILGHVLQCQRKNYFKKIQIWYDDEKPDPIVVGIAENKEENYLIGRWGAEDKSLEALERIAIDKLKNIMEKNAKKKLEECERVIKNPENEAEKVINGGWSEFD